MDSKACEQYHIAYYYGCAWNTVSYRGVPLMKSVSDLWNYQEIIWQLQPSLVVEFGCFKGGSALFFSDILKSTRELSKVLTVDISPQVTDPQILMNDHIEIMTDSSTSPAVAGRILSLRAEYAGRAFAILDSNHKKGHVLAEMELMRRVLQPGDYLVVEDGNINGHPVWPDWGEGPFEAIQEYEQKYPQDYLHDRGREAKFGFTFAPNGFLIKN